MTRSPGRPRSAGDRRRPQRTTAGDGSASSARRSSSIDEFVDLPVPVQALQLCTVVQEKVAGTGVELFEDGRCRLETEQGPVTVAAQDTRSAVADYPDRIAGRPSRTQLDPPDVFVRLVDDAQVELYVSAPDAAAVAGAVAPLLIS